MRLSTLLRTGLACAATATLGAVATDPDSRWYRSLDRPDWQPPAPVFPLVWTPLYADLAVASAAVLSDDAAPAAGRAAYARSLAVNLTLNAGWSWLFWRARRPWLAAAECAVLAASSADLARRAGAVRPGAGAALAPYAAWCGFATVLSSAIAHRNPRS
ncbi:TspO/MBR family protein [Thalassiella azotivora]